MVSDRRLLPFSTVTFLVPSIDRADALLRVLDYTLPMRLVTPCTSLIRDRYFVPLDIIETRWSKRGWRLIAVEMQNIPTPPADLFAPNPVNVTWNYAALAGNTTLTNYGVIAPRAADPNDFARTRSRAAAVIPVSARGRQILQTGAYRWDCRIDIIDSNGSTVLAKDIPVSDGTISWDIQRTAGHSVANIVVADPWVNLPQWDTRGESLIPKSTNSPLAPFGHRARITISVSDGGAEESFTFPDQLILDTRVDRPTGAISLECVDIAFLAEQRKLEGRETLRKGENRKAFIDRLWTAAEGNAPTVTVPSGVTLNAPAEEVWNMRGGDTPKEQDRASMTYWGIIRQVSRMMGCYVRTVSNGDLELIKIGDTANRATVSTGKGGEIINMQTEINRAQVVNKAIVVLEAEWKKRKGKKKNGQPRFVKQPTTQVDSAQITSGPLKYGGQMGELAKVYKETGKVYASKAAVKAEALRRAKVHLGDAEDTPGLARALTAYLRAHAVAPDLRLRDRGLPQRRA